MEGRGRTHAPLVEGEADAHPAQVLLEAWKDLPILRARWLPLPILGALFRRVSLFSRSRFGRDAPGGRGRPTLPVVALFGPTDPAVWAPPRAGVTVLRSPFGLGSLGLEEVFQAALGALKPKS